MLEGEVAGETLSVDEIMLKVDPAPSRSVHRISDQYRSAFRMRYRMAYNTMDKMPYKNWQYLTI
jgi:hypothetical protein